MAGYSIKQLLEWTLDDHLIEAYSIDDDGQYSISRRGETLYLSPEEARSFLVLLIRDGAEKSFRAEA